MTQPELFENEVNPEDYHIHIEAYQETSIDVWLEDGKFQLVVADQYAYNIFSIEVPIDQVKLSINEEEFAVALGDFRYKSEIHPCYLDKEIEGIEVNNLRWNDDSVSNKFYLPRKIEAYRKAGVQIFEHTYQIDKHL